MYIGLDKNLLFTCQSVYTFVLEAEILWKDKFFKIVKDYIYEDLKRDIDTVDDLLKTKSVKDILKFLEEVGADLYEFGDSDVDFMVDLLSFLDGAYTIEVFYGDGDEIYEIYKVNYPYVIDKLGEKKYENLW